MPSTTAPSIMRRRYSKMRENLQPVFDKVEVSKNLYKGNLIVDDTYEWDYTLVDPHVFPLVRNYLSRSNPSMSSLRLDVRHSDQYETRKVNQDFINWEIGELMATSLFYRQYFSAYLAGRGYIKTGWKYERAVKIEDKDAEGNVRRVKQMRDITSRADAKFVRFNNILVPDRNNPEFSTQPYYIELIQQRVGDMLIENDRAKEYGEKPYWDEKFIQKLRDSGVTNKLLDYEMDRVTDADGKDDLAFKSAYVPLMCMSTLDGEEFYMPMTSMETNDEIINTNTENRYWHGHYSIIDFTPFPEDDEYCNVALVDMVGDLQIAATEILNQTMTNIRQINSDMWVAGTGAAQTPDWQFRKRPDAVIRVVGDPTQIQQIKTQDNSLSAMKVGQDIQNKIERAGGISSLYSSGAPGQSINQTARGAQIIDQNIDTNMKMIIDLFGEQVLKRLGEHCLELNAQYVTEEQSFAVTGKRNVKDLISISPDQVSANFIVSVNPDKIQKQTPASRQASLQNTITTLQNIETQSQGAVQVDVIPIVDALIDADPNLDDVDEVVISLDEKAKRDADSLERLQMPEIKIRDPHKELIMAANIHFDPIEAFPPEVLDMVEKYVQSHMKYIMAEQELLAMSKPTMPTGANPRALGSAMGFDPSQAEQQGLPENQQTYSLGQIGGQGAVPNA